MDAISSRNLLSWNSNPLSAMKVLKRLGLDPIGLILGGHHAGQSEKGELVAIRFRNKKLRGIGMGFTSGNGRSHLICTAAITCALLCFAFMATGTASAATFKSVSGEVVIEAETYTRLGGNLGGAWFKNDEKKGYKGTGYIQSTLKDPKTLQYKSGNIRAEYDIDFKETGTYYLHLRTFAQNHTENGFFATWTVCSSITATSTLILFT